MKQFVNSMNSIYFETSSKENKGVDDLFLFICKKLIKDFENTESTESSNNKIVELQKSDQQISYENNSCGC